MARPAPAPSQPGMSEAREFCWRCNNHVIEFPYTLDQRAPAAVVATEGAQQQ